MFFPEQNIPEHEKNTEWMIRCVEAVAQGTISILNTRSVEKQQLYNIYNGNIDYEGDNRYDYLTFMGGAEPSIQDAISGLQSKASKLRLPAELRHYPIIRPRLDVLAGEDSERPIIFSLLALSEDIIQQKINDKVERYTDFLMNEIVEIAVEVKSLQAQIQQIQQAQQQGQQIPTNLSEVSIKIMLDNRLKELENKIEEFEEDIKLDDRHICERQATHLLNYLIYYLDLKKVFNDGFVDNMVVGEECYKVEMRAEGELPRLRNVNQINLVYPYNSNNDNISELPWVREQVFMSCQEVIDNFSEYLTAEQVTELEMITNAATGMAYASGYDTTLIQNYSNTYLAGLIRVIYVEWKSIRRIPIVRRKSANGTLTFLKIMDEREIPKKDFDEGNVEYRYIQDVWEGVKIHNNMYVRMRKRPVQPRRADCPSYTPLSYVGITYSNKNSMPLSMIQNCRQLQTLYDIVCYHRELLLAVSGTKGIIYDVGQIPKDMSMEMMLWYKKLGTVFINPAQDDLSPMERSGFNQFQSYDDTVSGPALQAMNELLASIESQVERITGVSNQRIGSIETKELVGTTERSVAQSSLNTAARFNNHYKGVERALTMLLEFTRYSLGSTTQALQYVLNPVEMQSLVVDGNIVNMSYYGVFLSNIGKDLQKMDEIKQMANTAMGAGTLSIADALEIFKSTDVNTASIMLQKALRKSEKKIAEQQQAQLQQQQQQAQMQQQTAQQQMQSTMQIETQKVQASLQIAQMGNQIDLQKLELDKLKLNSDIQIQASQNQQELERLNREIETKDKEYQLKREELSNKLELERLKIRGVQESKLQESRLAAFIAERNSRIKEQESESKILLEREKTRNKIEGEESMQRIRERDAETKAKAELQKLQLETQKMMDELQRLKAEKALILDFMMEKNELELEKKEDDLWFNKLQKKQDIEMKKEEHKVAMKIKATAPAKPDKK